MKIVGLMVVGPGEADRYLAASLNELKRLCDDAVLCLNNVDSKTRKLVAASQFWSYNDDREWGKYQPEIKTDLLKKVGNLRPDWVLPLDADEVFDSTVTRVTLEKIAQHSVSLYFYICNLWNSEERYARALSFWNIRFFRYLPEMGVQYLRKPVHCGLAPPFFYKYGKYVPYLVKHSGLLLKDDRIRKIERYKKYDPDAIHKGKQYYDALSSEATGSAFIEQEVLLKVEDAVSRMKQKDRYDDINKKTINL